jgi:hypothetical protein
MCFVSAASSVVDNLRREKSASETAFVRNLFSVETQLCQVGRSGSIDRQGAEQRLYVSFGSILFCWLI